MKKLILTILLALVILIIATSLIFANQKPSKLEYTNSWTKAICNETHCQDYQIYCDKDEFVSQSPLTGAVIKIPENWEDPRNEEDRNRVCDF